jgi:hypothetical protein
MALSKMQSAALSTTLLITLNLILKHEMDRNSRSKIYTWDDPAWRNLTHAVETLAGLNGTQIDPAAPFAMERTSFYLDSLPRRVFVYALLVPLQLYWNVWLEYAFPARPRVVNVSYKANKDGEKSPSENDARDEEVVNRLIAQGKVRRSSVSWRNTFLKWILDMTVGLVWYWTVFYLIHGIVIREGFPVTGSLRRVSAIYLFLPLDISSYPTIFSPPLILDKTNPLFLHSRTSL